MTINEIDIWDLKIVYSKKIIIINLNILNFVFLYILYVPITK